VQLGWVQMQEDQHLHLGLGPGLGLGLQPARVHGQSHGAGHGRGRGQYPEQRWPGPSAALEVAVGHRHRCPRAPAPPVAPACPQHHPLRLAHARRTPARPPTPPRPRPRGRSRSQTRAHHPRPPPEGPWGWSRAINTLGPAGKEIRSVENQSTSRPGRPPPARPREGHPAPATDPIVASCTHMRTTSCGHHDRVGRRTMTMARLDMRSAQANPNVDQYHGPLPTCPWPGRPPPRARAGPAPRHSQMRAA